MATTRPGADLEKELNCSVSARFGSAMRWGKKPWAAWPEGLKGAWANGMHIQLTASASPDLHRASLPAPDPPRLPAYVLRLLSEGLVRVAEDLG